MGTRWTSSYSTIEKKMSDEYPTDLLVKRWVWKGLVDFYFAFCIDNHKFYYHARFHELMGMEKFIKGLLIYSQIDELSNMPDQEAIDWSDAIAKSFGHISKNRLLQDVAPILGAEAIERLLSRDFDGYSGESLIGALQQGYMEYRYPMKEPVAKQFPTEYPNIWKDPLGSSGVTKLAYRVCNMCFVEMTKEIDFGDILDTFQHWFGEEEPFLRFNRLFWEHETGVGFPLPK